MVAVIHGDWRHCQGHLTIGAPRDRQFWGVWANRRAVSSKAMLAIAFKAKDGLGVAPMWPTTSSRFNGSAKTIWGWHLSEGE